MTLKHENRGVQPVGTCRAASRMSSATVRGTAEGCPSASMVDGHSEG